MAGLDDLLDPTRTMCRVEATSKKRIFELVAARIADSQPVLDDDSIYNQLLAREKLGSTGLGQGVAIPHCRVDGCPEPLGCIITLSEAVNFDAPDDARVDVLFVLIVPAEATQEHLNILATLARVFSDTALCGQLRSATSDRELLDTLMHAEAA